MLMYDDEREVKYYNNDLAQTTIAVGRDGITKIEVYQEHGNGDFIPMSENRASDSFADVSELPLMFDVVFKCTP